MDRFNNQPNLKQIRKILRGNMTEEEVILWSVLKGKKLNGKKFRRQHIVGNYVLDFYCPESKLAIEIDGSQHYETEAEEYDRIRTKYLNSVGIKVLRFTNRDIRKNIEGVCIKIKENLTQNPLVT